MLRTNADCLKENTILAFFAGQLAEPDAQQVEGHVDSCPTCRRLFMGAGRIFGAGQVTVRAGGEGGSAMAVLRFGTTDELLASLRQVPDDEYVVGRELARGGMGRVLEAVDRHGRRVAIKMLLHGGQEATLRFVREMQISARLQHPSTVTLYEAGRWSSGELFFSMRLVEGRSLLQALTEAVQLEDRLALLPRVLAVADAIAYAHDRGIIHRDLKPANVLLGDFGETVVVDWGLAKLVRTPDAPASAGQPADVGESGEEALTRHGTALGTPTYMSPEQARGQPLDERADVYSLGALLYHLLTRTLPYRADSAAELLERVRAGAPTPVQELAPEVPAELAAIVRKSMERRPEDRYASARELAEDLRHFATGRLVSAHLYTLAQLLRRWLRRHRAPLTVAAAFLLLLAAGTVASVARIVGERNRAERLQLLAASQRDSAEQLVDYLIGEFKNRVSSAERLDLLVGLGDEVAKYYRRSGGPLPQESAESLRRRASAIETLAFVEHDRKNMNKALVLYRDAIGLRELASAGGEPAPLDLVALGTTWNRIGVLENVQGRPEAALAAHRRALDLAERAASRDPDSIEPELLAAKSAERVTNTLTFRKGDVKGGVAAALAGIRRLSPVLARHPRDPRVLARLADLHGIIQYGELQLGQVAAAAKNLQVAMDLYRRALEIEPKNVTWARQRAGLLRSLSSVQLSRGHLAEALAAMNEHLDAYEGFARNDPQNRATQRDLGWAHADDCILKRRALRLPEAEAACDRSVRIFEEHVRHDPDSGESADALINGLVERGRVLHAQGRLAAASTALTRALTMARALLAKDPKVERWHEDLAFVIAALVPTELALGQVAAAERHLGEALPIARRQAAAAPEDAAVATSLGRLRILEGDVLAARAGSDEAAAAYRAAIASFEAQIVRGPEIVSHQVYRTEAALKLANLAPRLAPGGTAPSRSEARAMVQSLRRQGRLFPEDERTFRAELTSSASPARRVPPGT